MITHTIELVGGKESEIAVFTESDEEGLCRLACEYRQKIIEVRTRDFLKRYAGAGSIGARGLNIFLLRREPQCSTLPNGMGHGVGKRHTSWYSVGTQQISLISSTLDPTLCRHRWRHRRSSGASGWRASDPDHLAVLGNGRLWVACSQVRSPASSAMAASGRSVAALADREGRKGDMGQSRLIA